MNINERQDQTAEADKSDTGIPVSVEPCRKCECCEQTFSANTSGWYVDPEGVELCPECADDLWTEWKLGGHHVINA